VNPSRKSKERGWKPSIYRARASSRPYLRGGASGNGGSPLDNSLDTHGADLVGIKLGYDSSNFREKNRDPFTISAELQYG
jgi:hypothetical protein